jgi:hypothetical protein
LISDIFDEYKNENNIPCLPQTNNVILAFGCLNEDKKTQYLKKHASFLTTIGSRLVKILEIGSRTND